MGSWPLHVQRIIKYLVSIFLIARPPFREATQLVQLPSFNDDSSSYLGPTWATQRYVRGRFQHKFFSWYNRHHFRMGALYIGTLASAIIYGFCLLQASRYFRSKHRSFMFRFKGTIYTKLAEFGDDPWYIKTAVSLQPITCTPGLSNQLLQVITLLTFDTIQLFLIVTGGELWLTLIKKPYVTSSSRSLLLRHLELLVRRFWSLTISVLLMPS